MYIGHPDYKNIVMFNMTPVEAMKRSNFNKKYREVIAE